ncbi:MAG: CRTAC1 family protein [Ignavibacteriae bacterium]|nr:CRTAC1 family protein [Ignavibacteriota bacterium]
MKTFLFPVCAVLICAAMCQAQTPVTVKIDNGVYGGYHVGGGNVPLTAWEESAILKPAGPCEVTKLSIYFAGAVAARDTIYVVGDPSEGAIPPTSFVWSYNTLIDPIIFDYNGTPGWFDIPVPAGALRSDGYDRIVIQHRIKSAGPFFGIDNNGVSSPLAAFLYDPISNNTLGFPGVYYRGAGDFMIRLEVVYSYPAGGGSAQPPAATMVDVTKSAGIVDASNAIFKAGRVSVVDWDNDGFDDVAVGSNFYHNKKDGTFERVALGIEAGASVWADIDNDGDQDCYAVNGGDNDKVYRNDGGTFTDITAATKLTNPRPTVTPMWLDYNNDGRLDLFIANGRREASGQETYFPDQIWKNAGDGSFTNETQASGIGAAEPAPYYDCWAASACDYDDDGRTDIFVATYRLAPDLLHHNNGNGTFTNTAEATGLRGNPTASPQYFGHGAGCEWGDIDNSGYEDLIVGNLGHPDWRGQVSNPSLIFMNGGPSITLFEERQHEYGLKFFEMNFGVVLADWDLDGLLDVFHCQYAYNAAGASGEPYRRSRFYINDLEGSGRLLDRTWHTGANIHGAWTAARLDFDNDGDMDLIAASPTDAVRLFRNDLQKKGRYIGIRLTGDASQSVARDAFGTKVTVYAGGRALQRTTHSGGTGTTASQNSNEHHFGLGWADIDSVVIRYTNGTSRRFTTLLPNHVYRIAYDGTIETLVTDLEQVPVRPSGLALSGARASATGVAFTLSGAANEHGGIVDVYTLLGTRVASAPLESLRDGIHEIALAQPLRPGVYVLRLRAGVQSAAARFVAVH